MGRQHTFIDSQFNTDDYDPEDGGEFEPNLVFIIMSFKDDMDETYSVIKKDCSKLGLKAVRADETTGSGIVIREITQFIELAEFIICDLTHERPNVYYELGYAHGVGNEAPDILLIAREGTTLHFDIAPLRVFYYRSMDHLSSILAINLKRMIEITRS